MSMLFDFLIYLSIGLVFDRMAFSQLKTQMGMFWQLDPAPSYSSMLMPRILLLPLGATLASVSSETSERDAVAILGIMLLAAPMVIMCGQLIRLWLKMRSQLQPPDE